MRKDTFYIRYGKRLLDILCAACFLVLFWWLYAVIALLVRIKLGSPVLFRQTRTFKNGELGTLVKFRTMTDQRDARGNLLPDAQRLPPFGRWLRSTSLDELPEVFMILQGRLSLIGPRPLLPSYLPLYSPFQARRHEVTPGLTGYAQAYGRNSLSWEEKFEKDVYYVDHISFGLDLKILLKTFQAVLGREGISSDTCATMEVFAGAESEDLIYE